MLGYSLKKQDVVLCIETCSRSGKFQKHGEKSAKLIEAWLDPTQFNLKTTIDAWYPKSVEAFEVWVNGNLVHSEQQRSHGFLDSHSCPCHIEAVRRAVHDCIAGNNVCLPDERNDSEIKLDAYMKRQRDQMLAAKRRELAESRKIIQKDNVSRKQTAATDNLQSQEEDAQRAAKAAAAKERRQKAAAAKENQQVLKPKGQAEVRTEHPQKENEVAKEKPLVGKAGVEATVDLWLQALHRRNGIPKEISRAEKGQEDAASGEWLQALQRRFGPSIACCVKGTQTQPPSGSRDKDHSGGQLKLHRGDSICSDALGAQLPHANGISMGVQAETSGPTQLPRGSLDSSAAFH